MGSAHMKVETFVDEGAGSSSYLVHSPGAGNAVLIDPQRDVDRYLIAARDLGLRITNVLETHLHSDFLSGSRQVSAMTGARIGASAEARLQFDHTPLAEGDTVRADGFQLEVISTPAHTPEHISYSLSAEGSKSPKAVFTGGALMVGGAARTDLLGPDQAEPLARSLFRSIQKLMRLSDEVEVYPTHGAGSFCAAPVSTNSTSTIGDERAENYLVRAASEEEFVRLALADLPSYPPYFGEMRPINRRGPDPLETLPTPDAVEPDEFRRLMESGHAVVDIRAVSEYSAAHIPGAISIALREVFNTWVGWVVPFGTPILLVWDGSTPSPEEAIRQLIRIGYDQISGVLAGGIEAWRQAGFDLASTPMLDPHELADQINTGAAPAVLDVRMLNEWRDGHILGASHVEAGELTDRDPPFDFDTPAVIHCGHEERAATAASVLERRGWRNISILKGGWTDWVATGLPTVVGSD